MKRTIDLGVRMRNDSDRTRLDCFLDKVFAGKVAPLLATFVEGADLSDEELEEMRKILDDAKG